MTDEQFQNLAMPAQGFITTDNGVWRVGIMGYVQKSLSDFLLIQLQLADNPIDIHHKDVYLEKEEAFARHNFAKARIEGMLCKNQGYDERLKQITFGQVHADSILLQEGDESDD